MRAVVCSTTGRCRIMVPGGWGRCFVPLPCQFQTHGDLPWTLQEKHGCTSVFPSSPPSCPIRTEMFIKTSKKDKFPWQVLLTAVNCILLPAADSSCMLCLYYVSFFITIFPCFSCQLAKLTPWWTVFFMEGKDVWEIENDRSINRIREKLWTWCWRLQTLFHFTF